MRPAHMSIKRTGDREWSVFVVVADGRWKIATESTVDLAVGVALQRLADRKPIELEVTA